MFSPFQQGPGPLHVVDGRSNIFVPVWGTQRRVIVSAQRCNVVEYGMGIGVVGEIEMFLVLSHIRVNIWRFDLVQ